MECNSNQNIIQIGTPHKLKCHLKYMSLHQGVAWIVGLKTENGSSLLYKSCSVFSIPCSLNAHCSPQQECLSNPVVQQSRLPFRTSWFLYYPRLHPILLSPPSYFSLASILHYSRLHPILLPPPSSSLTCSIYIKDCSQTAKSADIHF